MERLYEIHSSGRYDLIIVDTPPTRNAIDFLEAPERMADFFSVAAAALADRAGPQPARHARLEALLHGRRPHPRLAVPRRTSPSSSCCSRPCTTASSSGPRRSPAAVRHGGRRSSSSRTLEAAPVREAEFFVDALRERKLHLGAVVLNKVLPDLFTGAGATAVARRLCADGDPIGPGGRRPAVGPAPPTSPACCSEVGESFLNFQVVAKREAEQRAELAAGRRRGGHRALRRERHDRPGGPPPPGRGRSGAEPRPGSPTD